jgi:hypothetical protein
MAAPQDGQQELRRYFAYGSDIFSSRLEVRVGPVQKVRLNFSVRIRRQGKAEACAAAYACLSVCLSVCLSARQRYLTPPPLLPNTHTPSHTPTHTRQLSCRSAVLRGYELRFSKGQPGDGKANAHPVAEDGDGGVGDEYGEKKMVER